MPVQRRYDFQIAGKGFLLARGQYKGRAWQRTGRSDTPGVRSQTDAQFGVLPDELDHPEVWNDWSGGYGHPYRETGANSYHWAENFDTRFPHQVVHAQQPQLLPSNIYSCANVDIMRICDLPKFGDTKRTSIRAGALQGRVTFNPTGQATLASAFMWIVGSEALLQYTGRMASFGSHNFWGTASGGFYRLNLGGSGGDIATTSLPGLHFVVAGGRLWRAHGAPGYEFRLQSLAAGQDALVAANWSATLAVGGGFEHINDVQALSDQVFCGMPNGLYAGDQSGTFVNLVGDMRIGRHDDNFRDLQVYEGGIVGQYSGGILWYRPSGLSAEIYEIGPASSSDKSPIRGRFRALATVGPWLYAGLWTGSQSYLMAGRPGPQGWAWHNMQRLPHIAAVGRLHFDSVTIPSGQTTEIGTHAWAACEPSITLTAPLYVWSVPRQDGNPLAADTLFTPNYIGSARIDLGMVNWGAPATPKIFRTVELESANLASGAQWCNIYYTVDAESTRHLLGTTARSPHDTLFFSSGEGSFVTGHAIELSLESFTASAQITPVYRTVILRGALQPRSVDMITAIVRVGDSLRDRMQGEMRSGATMLQELRDFANPDTNGLQAHQLIDLMGAVNYVKVLAPVEETETYQQGEENPEIAATVRMAVLEFS